MANTWQTTELASELVNNTVTTTSWDDVIKNIRKIGKLTVGGTEIEDIDDASELRGINYVSMVYTAGGAWTTSSGTFADVDATNAKINFTKASDSTDMIVAFGFTAAIGSGGTGRARIYNQTSGVGYGNTTGGMISVSSATGYMTHYAEYRVTGLAAGTYELRLQYNRATANFEINATSSYAPLFMSALED